MAQQLLDGPYVIAVFQQVCGEAMPKGMAAGMLLNAGNLFGPLQLPVEGGFMQVMAAPFAGARINSV